MQYIMLIYVNEKDFHALPKDEQNRVHRACGIWHEEIVKSGHTIDAKALQPSSATTTLRSEKGQVVITDGPFAETREVLGGFEVLECRDLDEALAIARRFPGLQSGGAVEVRPLILGGKCEAV